MYTTTLRKVGGSTMLAVPPNFLELLHLSPNAKVSLSVENDKLIVEPQLRPRYSLDELLAQCDDTLELSAEEQEWFDAKPQGQEII
jgi:antitoxin ChpS